MPCSRWRGPRGLRFQPDNILARYFLVDALTTVEDGQRFRIDLNVSF